MDSLINFHGQILHETYIVKNIEQIKCWTILRLEGASSIPLKRLYSKCFL